MGNNGATITVISPFSKENKSLSAAKTTAKENDRKRLQQEKVRQKTITKQKKKVVKEKRVVPKKVQETLPYMCVCDNYIFQIDKNRYSKTFSFEDINYKDADEGEEERIMLGYSALLNGFDSTYELQVTIHNNKVNHKDFAARILLKDSEDNYEKYRREYKS